MLWNNTEHNRRFHWENHAAGCDDIVKRQRRMRSIRPEIEYAFEIIADNVSDRRISLEIVFDDEIVLFDLTAALGRFGDRIRRPIG